MDSDSDFYGDEETVSSLQARVDSFDIAAWWTRHHSLLAKHRTMPRPPKHLSQLYNPYASLPGAWQLGEPISDFLQRLPPATTDYRPGLDWIWVANPYYPPRPEPWRSRFIEGGRERLALLEDFKQTAEANRKKVASGARASLDREVAKERRATVEDLHELAVAYSMLTGKWMLFPAPGCVNEVWAKVVQATVAGTLGIAAKVDTRAAGQGGKERVVCVYTKDFRDKNDVARVLNRLRELELVRPGEGRPLYYKSDAWTELGIYSGNGWGISPSLYSSNDIFVYMRKANTQR
ncbi:hypothetical protein VTJ83DRAFT_2984 [Remersonia thermophila]|uniref:DUF1917-domain-containing protein n=1 Tax=Remersonia thermophila TaxID=72144 RepID=A0ABR4DCR5_9PEZI